MAAEMLKKILEAENKAKDKLEKANKEADVLLANAENKAKEMLLNVKNETEKEGEKTLLECEQSANLLVEKRISEAKQECSRLKEISDKKNKECAEIVLKKIFV